MQCRRRKIQLSIYMNSLKISCVLSENGLSVLKPEITSGMINIQIKVTGDLQMSCCEIEKSVGPTADTFESNENLAQS